MRKIQTFFYILRRSLLDFDYYQELLNVKFTFSLKYLYVLLILTSFLALIPFTIATISVIPKIPQFTTKLKDSAKNFFPNDLVIKIKDGQLSTNSKEPVYLDGELVIDHLVTIDTNAHIEDYPKFKTMFLVTKTAIVMPKSNGRNEIYYLNEITNETTIDKNQYNLFTSQTEPLLNYATPIILLLLAAILLIFPIFTAGSAIILHLIRLLFVSSICFIIVKLIKITISFKQIYKLAIHASTLPILFFTFLSIFNLSPQFPFGFSLLLIFFLIAVFYRLKK